MKKITSTILITIVLSSCSYMQEYIDYDQDEIIHDYNKKSDDNIQKELPQWSCENWYKYWKNKTYKFEMCIPNDWDSIDSFWWRPWDFNDMTEAIWKFEDNNSEAVTSIYIRNNNSVKINWYWTTDEFITNIKENKLFVDWFERLEWNELIYKWTFLHLKSWYQIIVFFYDKNDKIQQKIIESINLVK